MGADKVPIRPDEEHRQQRGDHRQRRHDGRVADLGDRPRSPLRARAGLSRIAQWRAMFSITTNGVVDQNADGEDERGEADGLMV